MPEQLQVTQCEQSYRDTEVCPELHCPGSSTGCILAFTVNGETNFVSIDRSDVLNSAVEELKAVDNINLRLTLEISFYGEKARDAGGPRKEVFRLCLEEIKEKYFENGLRELVAEEYEYMGVIMALSILQNEWAYSKVYA